MTLQKNAPELCNGATHLKADPLGGKPDVALTFPATEEAVRRALSTTRQALRTYNLGEISLGMLEVVLAETCNNIVEHAYQDTETGVIDLTGRYDDGRIVLELSDTGQPMPGLEPPQKTKHNLRSKLEDLPEGGFGWGLIRDMTTSLEYRRSAGKNLLRMTLDTAPTVADPPTLS